MKKHTLFILLLCLSAMSLKAQFPALYNQYMFTGLALNPAYAGNRSVLQATFIQRNQWIGVPGSPSTQTFTLHGPTKTAKNSFGMVLLNDRYGVNRQHSISGVYAYRFELTNGRLSFGLQGGIDWFHNSYRDLDYETIGDEAFPFDAPPVWVPRVGFGMYYEADNFYFGASIPELLHYESDDYKQYIGESVSSTKYYLTAGYLFELSPDLKLKPSLLFKFITPSSFQFDINANFIIKDLIWIGASYRNPGTIVGLLEYQINRQLRMGYSFNADLSSSTSLNGGSHELMLSYEFGYKVKTIGPRYF